MHNPIFLAVDKSTREEAIALLEQVKDFIGGVKLGLEFFNSEGPKGVAAVMSQVPHLPLFLDLKLHDIPNTVASAVTAVGKVHPAFITIHAAGGEAMIAAAANAASQLGSMPPKILAVTVLTSLSEDDLKATGQETPLRLHVERLARLALSAGASGLICSPHEIVSLRQNLGKQLVLMVPGIRPRGSDLGDQKRTLTPAEAIAAGADYLVIGRPITATPNPARAAEAIMAELREFA
ncbi:MAG: orotidine-5'-phosphate decarboxylase [Alphaproteobacteria bacterium]